jgi:5-methylcytosine-specific restriction endonuclease McrA
MSGPIPKVCTACGARALPGEARCAAHLHGSGRPSSCRSCGRRVEDGSPFCPICAPSSEEAARLERQPYRRQYRSAEYRRNREIAWERCGGRCEGCGRRVTRQTAQCDHIRPIADGGSDALGNLSWLCSAACHPRKTRADRRARAERRRS